MATKKQKGDKYSRYADRMKASGYKKIHVWIPESEEVNIKRYIDRKRKAFEGSQA